jgi:CHASE3 domain sensor protein
MAERKPFDVPIKALVRRRVTCGLIAAVLLTVFLSFSSWRSVRRAEQDPYWVSHTHEVMAMIRGTSRDVLENGNQRGAFTLSGQEPLLVLYQTARYTIYQHASRLLVFVQEER